MTPSQRIHAALGTPPHAASAARLPFHCWVCAGISTRGVERSSWMGVTFVGQNRVRAPESPLVCEACVVVMGGRPPDTLRLTSHLVDDRGWLTPNKGDKPLQRAWLRGPKQGEWFAAIADSGKKHVIPWAPLNPAGSPPRQGQVLFEERLVTLGDWMLVDTLSELLTAGATKEEIERGAYGPGAWSRVGAAAIRDFERAWAHARDGGWFALAVWLAQRDEERVADRIAKEKEKRHAPRRNAARAAS